MVTEAHIWDALKEVKDPEIPTISLVDLGIIYKVKTADNQVSVELIPTFSGCPALKEMENLVTDKLLDIGIEKVEVSTTFAEKWDTNRITEQGLIDLKTHGLAPPPRHCGSLDLDVLTHLACPLCNSNNTQLNSMFGPTLCRSIHFCKDCLNAFEGFKPLV